MSTNDKSSIVVPLLFYFASLSLAFAGSFLDPAYPVTSMYNLSNLIGPLTYQLVHHAGFVTCTDAMQIPGNIICFHVHRMPLPPVLLAGLVDVFGDHYRAVDLAKIALVLIPVAAAFSLLWQELKHVKNQSRRWLIPCFFFLCLMLPTLLVDIIHMQVEEGYSFCLLAYAVAVLLFGDRQFQPDIRLAILFALSVGCLYLTKSSMILVCIFLVSYYCSRVRPWYLRMTVVLITLCAPLGWGLYSMHATGRFTLGTSLDGINLHKGNNAEFLDRYPPANDGSLDQYDAQLNNGKIFPNEWAWNDYHQHAALAFMKTHPVSDLHGDLRKADIFFVSFRKIGSEHYTGMLAIATNASMVIFRILLWSACLLAIYTLLRRAAQQRSAAVLYLGVVVAVAAPYIAGFAFTRHASVLILPSALYLAYWLIQAEHDDMRSALP